MRVAWEGTVWAGCRVTYGLCCVARPWNCEYVCRGHGGSGINSSRRDWESSVVFQRSAVSSGMIDCLSCCPPATAPHRSNCVPTAVGYIQDTLGATTGITSSTPINYLGSRPRWVCVLSAYHNKHLATRPRLTCGVVLGLCRYTWRARDRVWRLQSAGNFGQTLGRKRNHRRIM